MAKIKKTPVREKEAMYFGSFFGAGGVILFIVVSGFINYLWNDHSCIRVYGPANNYHRMEFAPIVNLREARNANRN